MKQITNGAWENPLPAELFAHTSNMAIFGGHGAGKTALAIKLALYESSILKTRIIVIDPKKEYTDICHREGGVVNIVGRKPNPVVESDFIVLNSGERLFTESGRMLYYNSSLSWVWSEVRTARAAGKPIRVVIEDCQAFFECCGNEAMRTVRTFLSLMASSGHGITLVLGCPEDLFGSGECSQPMARNLGISIEDSIPYKLIGRCWNPRSVLPKDRASDLELERRIRCLENGSFLLLCKDGKAVQVAAASGPLSARRKGHRVTI